MKNVQEAYLKMLAKQEPTSTPEVELVETTVPEELQHIPDTWDHHGSVDDETHEKMTKALKHGSFTHFPLESHGDADADVIEHLSKHGYTIKDYKAGIASTKKTVGNPEKGIPNRVKVVDEKIGSVLERTNASPEVKSAFVNDPTRAASKSGTQHHVVIATSPLAIAGMTTGTAWKNESCMNLEGGAYKHKLEDDSKHGTHVAFLVHHDDHTAFKYGEPSKPIARIALKPYHTQNNDDTIFRPEDKQYGLSSPEFHAAVSKWASENYPGKEGEIYNKNRNVYDDSNNSQYHHMSKEDVELKINSGHGFDDSTAIDSHNIDHALKYVKEKFTSKPDDTYVQKSANALDHSYALQDLTRIPNLSTHHVIEINKQSKSLEGFDHSERSHAKVLDKLMKYHGDKASSSMIDEQMANTNYPYRKMMRNPKLKDEHIDTIHPDQLHHVSLSKIKTKHIDKIVDRAKLTPGMSSTLRHFKDHLSEDHINTLATNPHIASRYVSEVMGAKNFSRNNHENFLKNISSMPDSEYIKPGAISRLMSESKHAKVEDANAIPSDSMYSDIVRNTNIPAEEHAKIKNIYMSNATGGDPAAKSSRYDSAVFGFSQIKSIPKTLSDHLTHEDYNKLADHNYRMSFEDPKHSNHYLDAFHAKAERLDKGIDEHIAHESSKNEDYDEDDDSVLDNKRESLEKHMANYARNLDFHVENHVIDPNNFTVKNGHELEKSEGRLRDIDQLEHYKTPNNSSRYDHEHYDDHFEDAASKLRDVRHNNRDDYDF